MFKDRTQQGIRAIITILINCTNMGKNVQNLSVCFSLKLRVKNILIAK